MSEVVDAQAGGLDFQVELDFDTWRWTASTQPPEGEFPFVVVAAGKRYEVYSDGSFAEEEHAP